MARVFTLSSGSSGNCAYIGDAKSGILVDMGKSFLRVKEDLEKNDMSLENVEAVVITHEHSDHIKGLETLCKKTDIPVYATEKTAEKLSLQSEIIEKNLHIIKSCEQKELQNTKFTLFNVHHDAVDTVGVRVVTADNRRVVLSTDTGHIDDGIFEYLKDADLNIIESNYDSNMLMCNVSYPFLLRRRIASNNGHLSNADCAKTVLELLKGGNRRFVLAHLSEQNNTPEIAFETVRLCLDEAGYVLDKDFELSVAPRAEMSKMMVF